MTYLTVPIAAPDIEKAKQQIKSALAAGAEMFELRIDYLENLNKELLENLISAARAIIGKAVPIIVTCRDIEQGGANYYPDHLRAELLSHALMLGANYIDFEYDKFLASFENQEKIKVALSSSLKGKLIMSAHNFESKFDNIEKLYRHIITLYPAAVPKLVYKANHINDCFPAFDLLNRTSGERIIFCMGPAGVISRIIAKKLGSLVSFAAIDEKNATAPGQLTIKQLKDLYRFNSITPDTQLYGVIASPVAHSMSPHIHNSSFAKAKLDKLYLPLLVDGGQDGFNEFMKNILARNWLDFKGFSITLPHKQNALKFIREKNGVVEPLARRIGAVNTLIIGQENLLGYNTDCKGAIDAIISGLEITKDDFKDMPVAVIGAGGVSRAVVAGLTDAGAKVKIYNRTVEKAQQLASDFRCSYAGLDDLKDIDAKLLINCTSIGMHPDIDSTPVPKEFLKKQIAVFDTVYNPPETTLLKLTKQKKAKVVDGVSMFVNQALAQFELFTGQKGNAKLMRKTVCDCLAD